MFETYGHVLKDCLISSWFDGFTPLVSIRHRFTPLVSIRHGFGDRMEIRQICRIQRQTNLPHLDFVWPSHKKEDKEGQEQAGAELGQAQIRLELRFISNVQNWLTKLKSLNVLVELTNFPFYTFLIRFDIAELAIASSS